MTRLKKNMLILNLGEINMFNKIRSLDTKGILLLVFGVGFLYLTMIITKEGSESNNVRELVIQHEPWLEKTSNYVFDYMNEPESDLWISNNGASFTSIYSNSHFLPKKLESLRTNLVETGWYELSPEYYSNDEELETLVGLSLTNTVILCKNKAAIIIWMYDLKKKYGNMTDSRTMIWVLFDYQTPCFDLENKKSKS